MKFNPSKCVHLAITRKKSHLFKDAAMVGEIIIKALIAVRYATA